MHVHTCTHSYILTCRSLHTSIEAQCRKWILGKVTTELITKLPTSESEKDVTNNEVRTTHSICSLANRLCNNLVVCGVGGWGGVRKVKFPLTALHWHAYYSFFLFFSFCHLPQKWSFLDEDLNSSNIINSHRLCPSLYFLRPTKELKHPQALWLGINNANKQHLQRLCIISGCNVDGGPVCSGTQSLGRVGLYLGRGVQDHN